jgi:hypothetical protein
MYAYVAVNVKLGGNLNLTQPVCYLQGWKVGAPVPQMFFPRALGRMILVKL